MFATRFATRGTALEAQRSRQGNIGIPSTIMLSSIFLFFTGMGSIWAFMEPIGRRAGLDVGHIASALSASAIAQLAGSLLVSAIGDRLSAKTATTIGVIMIAVTATGLSVGGFPPFLIGVCILNFAWGFLFPFLFRSMVQIDRHGSAALTPMATGAGLMVGPALGGVLMERLGTGVVATVFACLTIGGLLISFFTNRQGVRTMPTGPEANALHPSTTHA
jgi:predicted MFS family arabinose efflux permease